MSKKMHRTRIFVYKIWLINPEISSAFSHPIFIVLFFKKYKLSIIISFDSKIRSQYRTMHTNKIVENIKFDTKAMDVMNSLNVDFLIIVNAKAPKQFQLNKVPIKSIIIWLKIELKSFITSTIRRWIREIFLKLKWCFWIQMTMVLHLIDIA